ncbi:hypothetical protein BD414DRAFT_133926 [Trametes punicea]|nr:hypothetical protein BD414DRAFT_133926 [Trametes punicea]
MSSKIFGVAPQNTWIGHRASRAAADVAREALQPSRYVPLTWGNALFAHSYLLPYIVMAYLTRRPGTYAVRLLLLPLTVLTIIRCTVHYHIDDPVYGWYNWLRGLAAFAAIAKVTHFAVVPEGTLKTGEECLQAPQFEVSCRPPSTKGERALIPPFLSDALELGTAARGIGWEFGRGVHVPRVRRPLDRGPYLRVTLLSVLRTYLLVDFFDSFLETLPGITVSGGTIFFPNLHPVARYIVSTALHLGTGIIVILGLEMWYDVASLIGVGLFHQVPSQWPPVHDEPWRMSSLHEFWSKGWHQILRDTFLVMGGYPGKWIAGDTGMLFGTFIASGLFHEIGLYLGGAPIDGRVMFFFVAQAFGILLEKFYRYHTGRRVGGLIGRLWAAIFVVGFGQLCTESWIARGAGGRALVPPPVSPTRQLLFPVLRPLMQSVRS